MDKLKIVSLNVRGMVNDMKQRRVFRYLKQEGADIALVQETHCEKSKERIWEAEWGSKIIFSNGDSRSKGVAILLTKTPEKNIIEVHRDIYGRMLMCKIKINELIYNIVNIYAPNTDDDVFFDNLFEQIKTEERNSVFTVIGGDFNVIRDSELDRSNNKIYHTKAKRVVDEFINAEEYADVWREENPEKKFFTWMKSRARNSWSRLDYFLVSPSLRTKVIGCDIRANATSDHSLISLDVCTTEDKRGPGYWKFNEELLNDEAFCKNTENLLRGTQRVYEYLDAFDKWEQIKEVARKYCISYSKAKARERNKERFVWYENLCKLQGELCMEDVPREELYDNIDLARAHIEHYEIQDAQRSAFRCKRKWIDCGEKANKYYFGLEKRNFLSKTMYMIRKPNGQLTKDYTEILDAQYAFYKELYTKNERVKLNVDNLTGIQVNMVQKNSFEEMISIEECYDAIMTLKMGKTPGGTA